ncbi:MAG: MBL fold metallo-hydrolase [Alphaproteobacteria bacterium]|nr:MBL fold metallo-hydrolase [Alphaproteobacteria bacterium]
MIKSILTPLVAAAGVFAFAMAASTAPAQAQVVKVTPIGQVDGEFCNRDRALLFEDPDGTTILYDPGRTVRGPTDPRLPQPVEGVGGLDGVVLTSVHSDHLGDFYLDTDATCAGGGTQISTTPNSNTAEIVAGHPNSFIPGPGELTGFLRTKILAAGGTAGQIDTLRHGGVKMIGGVEVAVIVAHHSNGVSRAFLTGNNQLTNPAGNPTNGLTQHILPEDLAPDGLTAYVGPENGFVLTFTNGLVVYLSGDTGQFGDMKTVVKEYYSDFRQPGNGLLAVVHMGGKFSMGPDEAAWATETLLEADSVIPEHANQASTVSGVVQPGTNVANFQAAIAAGNNTPVHVPLSNVTMCFDNTATKVACP